MIDKVFGRSDKKEYFPKTSWNLDGKSEDGTDKNGYLQPDTIMEYEGNIYVLDGKYYKYGATGKPGDLPGTSSINKQITYGEHIAENERFKQKHGKNMKVYNAFVIPFDAKEKGSEKNKNFIGTATSSWKDNSKEYEQVQGILLDVKHLMQLAHKTNLEEIMEMAKLIEEHCEVKKKFPE